ncbi:E3 ubiquitin ligase BIG BROTHER-related-like [Hibiscus syriacus]|uniref:E3 ubiquitin ligase BIG BROTHER-related-like n=1 Tax=Hibiscus syriacus TaxID=106335 RepID=UPI0019226712|nr:E3 ubiquitin ligase BIG BROTHER-related-like [Hibiscus syriacus]
MVVVDIVNLTPSVPLNRGIPKEGWTGKRASYNHLKDTGISSMLETIESNYDNDDDQSNNGYEYFEVKGDLEFLDGRYINDINEDTEYDDEDDNEIDLGNFSYEELIAWEEIIGVVKKGVSEEEFSSCLTPFKFRSIEHENGIVRCVICQVEYVDNEGLVALPNCEHPYHSDCISKWLGMKKNCPHL